MVTLPHDAAIVAATLRQLAGWSDEDRTPEALTELATVVEGEDYSAGWCCPMCEEIECDGGCPLEHVRAGQW